MSIKSQLYEVSKLLNDIIDGIMLDTNIDYSELIYVKDKLDEYIDNFEE